MLSHLLRVMMSCAALVRTSAVLQGGPRAAARGCRWRGTAVLHLRTRSVASREHSGHGENLPLHAHTHPSRYGDKFIPRGPSAVPISRDGGTAPALTRVRTGARVAAELRDEGAERVRAPSYLNYTHVRHTRASAGPGGHFIGREARAYTRRDNACGSCSLTTPTVLKLIL